MQPSILYTLCKQKLWDEAIIRSRENPKELLMRNEANSCLPVDLVIMNGSERSLEIVKEFVGIKNFGSAGSEGVGEEETNLLLSGADFPGTPLHIACAYGSIEVISFLTTVEPSVLLKYSTLQNNNCNGEQVRPLECALFSKRATNIVDRVHLETVEYLNRVETENIKINVKLCVNYLAHSERRTIIKTDCDLLSGFEFAGKLLEEFMVCGMEPLAEEIISYIAGSGKEDCRREELRQGVAFNDCWRCIKARKEKRGISGEEQGLTFN